MATSHEYLSKLTISIAYVLLSINISLTIASSYLYEVPILISLTIITLHLLTCDIFGGLLMNGRVFASMKNYGKKILSKLREILANQSQAEKAKNLQNMNRALEQESKGVLQDQEECTGVHTDAKDEESGAARVISCNPSSGVATTRERVAFKKMIYDKKNVLEKLEKLPYIERQFWNPKQAAIASILTEDIICQESISTTADGDCPYVYVQCDDGKNERKQKAAALLAEEAQIESENQELKIVQITVKNELEKSNAKHYELVKQSKQTDQVNQFLASYSARELAHQIGTKLFIIGQRWRRLELDKHALELESWVAGVNAHTRDSVAAIVCLKDANAEGLSPAEYQCSVLEILNERYARLLEEKPILVENEQRAQQQLELHQALHERRVMQLKPNPDHRSISGPEGRLVTAKLEEMEEELEMASGLVIDNRWEIYTHRMALERLKTYNQQVQDIDC